MSSSYRMKLDRGIIEIAAVFTDPIIVSPGGWGADLPEWLKKAITVERLVANVAFLATGQISATDAEACAYLYSAAFQAPMDHDWSQIFLYVSTKVYERHRTKESGVTMPPDSRVDELDRQQKEDLGRLKEWIYRTRVSHRRRNSHEPGKEVPKKEAGGAAPEVVQPGFDFGEKT